MTEQTTQPAEERPDVTEPDAVTPADAAPADAPDADAQDADAQDADLPADAPTAEDARTDVEEAAAPLTDEADVADDAPVTDEAPAPLTDEAYVTDDARAPVVDEAPAPLMDEAYVADDASVAGEAPLADEAPSPVTDEAATAEATPAQVDAADALASVSAVEAGPAPAPEAVDAPDAPDAPAGEAAPAEAEPAPEADAPAAEAEAPATDAGPTEATDAGPTEAPHAAADATGAGEPVEDAQATAQPAPAAGPPTDRPDGRPTPRVLARPAARRPAPGAGGTAPAVPVPPVDAHDAAAAAAWGRVDPDGTVWVREAAGERSVGQYPGADTEEALAFYVRRFLDIQAQVALFEARLPHLSTKEMDQTLKTLRDSLEAPTAVGDLDGLRARVEGLAQRAAERRKELAAEREAAKAQALTERTAIVERAEEIAGTDPARLQWRASGEELRALLDRWKSAQRSGPRLDRPSEDELWKRFSHARTTFDRHRRQYFAELDATQGQAKAAKEKLVERAEALSGSTEWGATAAAYRGLMDEWKAAGRASRKDDDALWARFRAAQQAFFDARSAQNAKVDEEFGQNLERKLELLTQAEALLPVTDAGAAKSALRRIQDAWDEIGKVPRADVQRVEARMRAVEQAVRDADEARWHKSDPEKKARAEGAAAQLQEAIVGLEQEVAAAEASGDERAAVRAREALEARRLWLDQVLRAAGEGH
ncbi:DUF349 domain-containing protein [Georgenia faecalis]|uniref:DUF349 domain-containing protein n=1 Tax=Georgenia faecalis TaxID=2483799 RepID=A0ABV9D8V6_9MICO|nr:DUF349 domain-containing protein [Georgenia faecalis]